LEPELATLALAQPDSPPLAMQVCGLCASAIRNWCEGGESVEDGAWAAARCGFCRRALGRPDLTGAAGVFTTFTIEPTFRPGPTTIRACVECGLHALVALEGLTRSLKTE
jgi:hypothetical protein